MFLEKWQKENKHIVNLYISFIVINDLVKDFVEMLS